MLKDGEGEIARGTIAFFYHQMLEKHHQAQLPLHTHRAGAASKLGPLGAVTAMLHLFAVWLFPRVSIFHSLPAHKRIICDFLRLLHCDILSDQFRSITSSGELALYFQSVLAHCRLRF